MKHNLEILDIVDYLWMFSGYISCHRSMAALLLVFD